MMRAGGRLTFIIGWEDKGREGYEPVSAGIATEAIGLFQRRWRRDKGRLPETYWVEMCPKCLACHKRGGCR